nr:hypothetical protein [Tanacetum cinerariifolium]
MDIAATPSATTAVAVPTPPLPPPPTPPWLPYTAGVFGSGFINKGSKGEEVSVTVHSGKGCLVWQFAAKRVRLVVNNSLADVCF